jgi:hypothetical protein
LEWVREMPAMAQLLASRSEEKLGPLSTLC